MDGWMDGWMNGWMDGWMDGWNGMDDTSNTCHVAPGIVARWAIHCLGDQDFWISMPIAIKQSVSGGGKIGVIFNGREDRLASVCTPYVSGQTWPGRLVSHGSSLEDGGSSDRCR
jgi:hypothetical protein